MGSMPNEGPVPAFEAVGCKGTVVLKDDIGSRQATPTNERFGRGVVGIKPELAELAVRENNVKVRRPVGFHEERA